MEITEISEDTMVSVEDLNVTLGKKQIVQNISFSVKNGEIIGMFGISGAGKTTIIRVLTCQIENHLFFQRAGLLLLVHTSYQNCLRNTSLKVLVSF